MNAVCRMFLAALALLTAFAAPAVPGAHAGTLPPQPLDALLALERPPAPEALPIEGSRRLRALRLAARSWGAQAGLARRGWEIGALLERHAGHLSAVWRFEALAETVEGFALMPPAAMESGPALQVAPGGAAAVSAARVIRMGDPARFVLAVPGWRDWLVRAWAEPVPPDAALWPRDDAERKAWVASLRTGWWEGVRMAEASFLADLARLEAAWEGMIAWRRLRLQGMATALSFRTSRLAVVGGGSEMVVDERRAEVAEGSRLDPSWTHWTPAAQRSPAANGEAAR